MNTVRPRANIRLKPIRSATAENGNNDTTTARLYAIITHTAWPGGMLKSRAMAGKATLARGASSDAMVSTTIRVATAQWRRGGSKPSGSARDDCLREEVG